MLSFCPAAQGYSTVTWHREIQKPLSILPEEVQSIISKQAPHFTGKMYQLRTSHFNGNLQNMEEKIKGKALLDRAEPAMHMPL